MTTQSIMSDQQKQYRKFVKDAADKALAEVTLDKDSLSRSSSRTATCFSLVSCRPSVSFLFRISSPTRRSTLATRTPRVTRSRTLRSRPQLCVSTFPQKHCGMSSTNKHPPCSITYFTRYKKRPELLACSPAYILDIAPRGGVERNRAIPWCSFFRLYDSICFVKY